MSSQELERTIKILAQFREGNSTEGLTSLEKCLDGSLLLANGSDRNLNYGMNWVPTYIQNAADYRKKYPWTNSTPKISEKVQAILTRAK